MKDQVWAVLLTVRDVADALREGDDEGAIEEVFELWPDATRDQAVDVVTFVEALATKGEAMSDGRQAQDVR